MGILILLITLGVLVPVVLFSNTASKSWEDESRIVNAHWLNSADKFHLISRWGAQY